MSGKGVRKAMKPMRRRASSPSRAAHPALRALLSGGDRRDLARSAEASRLLHAAPSRISELAALVTDTDWLVAMRALDLLEKLAHEDVAWVAPHKHVFLGPAADAEPWETRLQVVRALPLFGWTKPERARALEILRRDVAHPRAFVAAWALDGVVSFAQRDPSLLPEARALLARFARSPRKSLATRARHAAARLNDPR